MEMEHQVEFAHRIEELIQGFHKEVYGFQVGQLIVVHIDTEREIQASISSIDNLIISKLYKVSSSGVSLYNQPIHLTLELALLFRLKWRIPFRQTSFALPIL